MIELLAVIVILAIITLIAVPIIAKIIEETEESANQRSIELYADAVEQAVTKYKLKGNTKSPTFSELEIKYDGQVECKTRYIYLDGSIYLADCYIKDDLVVDYAYGERKYETVYFDVSKGEKCSQAEYEKSYDGSNYLNSNTGYNGIQMTNNLQNSCLKFYVINYEKEETLDLILDHNTTGTIAWNKTNSNELGPSTASDQVLGRLKTDTSYWKGTETPENYTLDQTGQVSGANYTIDYSGYKARLITAQEVANITNNKFWNEVTSTKFFYFDSGTEYTSPVCGSSDTSGCEYGWLYNKTSGYYGYWTATAKASTTDSAWCVENKRLNSSYSVGNAHYSGLRPVITILKSKLS